MRTFNVRLAAILLGIVVVACVGIYLLHGYQMRRNARVYLTQAHRAMDQAAEAAKKKDVKAEEEANKEAIRCLGWYVRFTPKDAEALEKLGLLQAKQAYDGNIIKSGRAFIETFGLLERAVLQGPDRQAARRELVKMAMLPQVRRYQDAKTHLEGFLLKESPKDPELLEMLGQCQTQLGDYNLALETFKKVIEHDQSRFTAYAQIAGLLRLRLSRPKEANQWMKKLVVANPKSAKAHVLRGRYLLSTDAKDLLEEAADEAAMAVKLAPDDLDTLALAAECAVRQQQLDKARSYAAHAIKLHPENPTLHLILSEIELRDGHRDKAINALEQGLKSTDRHPQLLWRLANMLIDSQDRKNARKTIEELRTLESSRPVPDYYIGYLNARMELAEGHWLAARKSFEKIRGSLVAEPQLAQSVDLWIGGCYRQSGDRDQEIKAYRRALSVNPDYTPARQALIDALLAMDRVDEAIVEQRRMPVSKSATATISPSLIRALISRTARQEPSERNWTPVEKALEMAEKARPDAPEVVLMRAQVLVAQGHEGEVEDLLRSACAKNPKQTSYWMTLAALVQRQGDLDKLETALNESEKALGDTAAQRVMRANYLIQRYGKDAKDRLRKLAENTDKFSDDDCVQLWGGLLDSTMEVGDLDQVKVYCQKIAEKRPDNAQIRYIQFRLALGTGDRAAMTRSLDDIRKVAGQSAYWLWGQAILLAMRSQEEKPSTPLVDQAIAYLNKARELRGDWLPIPKTLAQIYLQQGRPDLALKNYLEALDLGDRDPMTIRQAIQILYQTQQYAEADQRIRWLERQKIPFSRDMYRMSSEIAIQRQDFDRALEMARKAGIADSKNYREHVWLGQILDMLGSHAKTEGRDKDAATMFDESETSLRRAVKLEPGQATTWIALLRHYVVTGQTAEAEKTVQEAGKNIPAKDAALAMAQCYAVMGMTSAATKKFDEALAAAPNDLAVVRQVADFYVRTRQTTLADPLLQKIIDGTLKAELPDVVWARRELALTYAQRGTYQNLKKAEKLLEQNRASPAASTADLQILARLYASDPNPARRGEAVGMIEDMIRKQSATREDRFALAQLYLAERNWAKASAYLRNLAADRDAPPQYLMAYIAALLQHGETADVNDYLQRLKKLTSNGFAAVGLEADWLCALRRHEEALDLLTKYVDRTDVQPADRADRVQLAAEKLTEIGRDLAKSDQQAMANRFASQAEKFYRESIKGRSGQELPLAIFLARQGKATEALNLLDGVWEKAQPAALSQVYANILDNKPADKAIVKRLEESIAKAIEKHERPVPLLMVMADFCTREGRYADAETNYREVLKKSPRDAVAMNNLAVLLALQGEKLDESLQLANGAIDVLGPLGPVLDSRAIVYMARQEPRKAIQDINDALADRETPVRYFHQAQIFMQLGQENSAKNAIFKAQQLELKPNMLQPLELPAYEKLKKLLNEKE